MNNLAWPRVSIRDFGIKACRLPLDKIDRPDDTVVLLSSSFPSWILDLRCKSVRQPEESTSKSTSGRQTIVLGERPPMPEPISKATEFSGHTSLGSCKGHLLGPSSVSSLSSTTVQTSQLRLQTISCYWTEPRNRRRERYAFHARVIPAVLQRETLQSHQFPQFGPS